MPHLETVNNTVKWLPLAPPIRRLIPNARKFFARITQPSSSLIFASTVSIAICRVMPDAAVSHLRRRAHRVTLRIQSKTRLCQFE